MRMTLQHRRGMIAMAAVLGGACSSMAQCTQYAECTTYANSGVLTADMCGTIRDLGLYGSQNITIVCPVFCNACPSTTTVGDTLAPTTAPSAAPTTVADAALTASVNTRGARLRCQVDTNLRGQSQDTQRGPLFPDLASMASMTLRACISMCADPQTVSLQTWVFVPSA
jgi:hypothetical protein